MKKPISYIVALVVCIALIGVLYFGYMMYTKEQLAKFNASYQAAYKSYNLGDANKAVELSTPLVASAPTKETATEATLLEASALFARNKDDDRKNAVNLLKGVIADNGVNNTLKAGAYTRMGAWFITTGDATLMRDLVFSTPPYSDYLARANGSVPDATIHLFQLSNTLSPSVYANYEMAYLSATQLLKGGIQTKDKNQIQTATTIRQTIATGDAMPPSKSTATYGAAFETNLYLARAISLGIISRYLGDVSTTTVDAAYETAISIANSDPQSSVTQYYGSLARFTYAASLNSREYNRQNVRIETLLKDISFQHTMPFETYMRSVIANPSDVMYAQLAPLANISPEFKKYISSLGWHN